MKLQLLFFASLIFITQNSWAGKFPGSGEKLVPFFEKLDGAYDGGEICEEILIIHNKIETEESSSNNILIYHKNMTTSIYNYLSVTGDEVNASAYGEQRSRVENLKVTNNTLSYTLSWKPLIHRRIYTDVLFLLDQNDRLMQLSAVEYTKRWGKKIINEQVDCFVE